MSQRIRKVKKPKMKKPKKVAADEVVLADNIIFRLEKLVSPK